MVWPTWEDDLIPLRWQRSFNLRKENDVLVDLWLDDPRPDLPLQGG
jgi:hypothetical protein